MSDKRDKQEKGVQKDKPDLRDKPDKRDNGVPQYKTSKKSK